MAVKTTPLKPVKVFVSALSHCVAARVVVELLTTRPLETACSVCPGIVVVPPSSIVKVLDLESTTK